MATNPAMDLNQMMMNLQLGLNQQTAQPASNLLGATVNPMDNILRANNRRQPAQNINTNAFFMQPPPPAPGANYIRGRDDRAVGAGAPLVGAPILLTNQELRLLLLVDDGALQSLNLADSILMQQLGVTEYRLLGASYQIVAGTIYNFRYETDVGTFEVSILFNLQGEAMLLGVNSAWTLYTSIFIFHASYYIM